MSPNTTFRPGDDPQSPVAELVLRDPAVVYEPADDGALVIAVRSELIVHRRPGEAGDRLRESPFLRALEEVAVEVGTLAGPSGDRPTAGAGGDRPAAEAGGDRPAAEAAEDRPAAGPAESVEVWRLRDSWRNSIDEARRLRGLAGDGRAAIGTGAPTGPPIVAPNHVAIVSPRWAGCPAGPPYAARAPRRPYIPGRRRRARVRVAVLDTGYIAVSPPHERLDQRVTSVPGQMLDTSVDPPAWRDNPPDAIDLDPEGRLLGIVGHGTFIAGQVAHTCPEAAITVVGHRDAELPVDPPTPGLQLRLWASEASIARSLIEYADVDVIQCGFAFPTLDDYPSLPFDAAMRQVRRANRGIAVVAPAGNEASTRRYWPAALDDVIGVAATNRRARHRAHFSNWGAWCDCAARGEDVRSTYIRWEGPVESDDPDDDQAFDGWARWDGTSFAAPKVSAAIARLVAQEPALTPMHAFHRLIDGHGGVEVTPVTDYVLYPGTGLTLPQLHVP